MVGQVGPVAMGAERAGHAVLHCLPVALRETERVSEASGWEAGPGPVVTALPVALQSDLGHRLGPVPEDAHR